MAIPLVKSRLATFDPRRVKPPAKTAASVYQTADHRRWSEAVITRAGGQCEQVVDGQRCRKARPRHRMFADHVKELKDGGAPFDLDNGMCLCGAHHTAKTAQARAARRG
jgi:5-methylcytosine-specific restriction enzyme A